MAATPSPPNHYFLRLWVPDRRALEDALVRDDTVFAEAAPYPVFRFSSSRSVSSISRRSQIEPWSICARVG